MLQRWFRPFLLTQSAVTECFGKIILAIFVLSSNRGLLQVSGLYPSSAHFPASTPLFHDLSNTVALQPALAELDFLQLALLKFS